MHADDQSPATEFDTKSTSHEADEDDEWDGSSDDFLTDEEYDILDASDEEFVNAQLKQH